MNDVVIRVKNLCKVFRHYPTAKDLVFERLLGGVRHSEIVSLNNVSFEVKRSEIVGLVGPNGAGKSTLLKIIAGVLPPTSGEVEVNGRIHAILELGTGFRPDYTGRENILIGGLYLGYSRQEICNRTDWIVSFSGLREFIEIPFGNYSSGMQARLMFALAVSIVPDVLIIDEALAVGDAAFARKCFERLNEITAKGTTVLFVTHSMAYVTRSCTQGIYIEDGEIKAIDEPLRISQMYDAAMLARSPELSLEPFDFEKHRQEDRDLTLLSVDVNGEPLTENGILRVGGPVMVRFTVSCKKRFDHVFAYCQLVRTRDGETVTALHNWHRLDLQFRPDPVRIDLEPGCNVLELKVPFLNLSRGKYALNFGIAPDDGSYSYDDMLLFARNCQTVSLQRQDLLQSVQVELPSDWTVRRGPSPR